MKQHHVIALKDGYRVLVMCEHNQGFIISHPSQMDTNTCKRDTWWNQEDAWSLYCFCGEKWSNGGVSYLYGTAKKG